MSNYLYHHGIKGMHWGIRRFQNEDGTLTAEGKERYIQNGRQDLGDDDLVLKKGSSVNSVSVDKKFKLSNKALYSFDKNDEWDSAVYRGAYSKYLLDYRKGNSFGNVYEHEYTTRKDIVIPSYKSKIDTLVEMYKDNPVDMVANVWYASQYIHPEDPWIKGGLENGKKYIQEMKDGKFDNVFKLTLKSLDTSYSKAGQDYIEKLQSKGYGGMVDDHNATVYNRANNPLIVFDAKNNLKENGKSKKLTFRDVDNNLEILRKNMNGESIKLSAI